MDTGTIVVTDATEFAFGAFTLSIVGGGSFDGHIVYTPIVDEGIYPHGQMENSRFDIIGFSGALVLTGPGLPPVGIILAATDPGQVVTGRAVLQLHRTLPGDDGTISSPLGEVNLGMPVTPYSISIKLDQDVHVLPGILGPEGIMASNLKVTKGKILVLD